MKFSEKELLTQFENILQAISDKNAETSITSASEVLDSKLAACTVPLNQLIELNQQQVQRDVNLLSIQQQQQQMLVELTTLLNESGEKHSIVQVEVSEARKAVGEVQNKLSTLQILLLVSLVMNAVVLMMLFLG